MSIPSVYQLSLFSIETIKRCPRCGQEKSTDCFHKQTASKDGLSGYCKDCARLYSQGRGAYRSTYRKDNAEQIAVDNAAYRVAHRDEIRAKSATYRAAHRERANAQRRESYNKDLEASRERGRDRARQYRERHLELARAKERAWYRRQHPIDEKARIARHETSLRKREDFKRVWYQHNKKRIALRIAEDRKVSPERFRVHEQRRSYRYRAAPGHYTVQDLRHLYVAQNGCCHYCGKPLNNTYEVEHKIPLSKPGTSHWPHNLALSCRPCNRRKGAKTDTEFHTLLASEHK